MSTADSDTNDQTDELEVAVAAVTRAIREINNDERPGDGAEFITHLLATVAANLGSTDASPCRGPARGKPQA
jgi:hypothetical protein